MAIIELKGLKGIDKANKDSYVNKLKSSGIIDNTWTDSEIDRVYKNDQFISKFGEELFNSISDIDTRDRLFRNAVLEEELNRFSSDPNINIIRRMTPEGQQELFESGYLTPEERSKESLASDNLSDNQISLLDKIGLSNTVGGTATRALEGGLAGLGIGTLLAPFSFGVSVPVATAVGAAVGAVTGSIEGLWDRYGKTENLTDDVNALNDELFNKAFEKDIERKRNSEEVKSLSNNTQSSIQENIRNGSLSFDEVDNLFNTIVGKQGDDSYGSTYYEAFKDSYLKDIDESTKIKVVSDFLAMQELHPDVAFSGIDQIFQNIVSDRQSVGDEYLNVLKRNALGLANDIAQIPTDAVAATIQLVAGDEAAQKYLEEGKIGNIDLGYLGPDFWNKAAKYNTFSIDDIEKAEKLGGLSTGTNVKEVGASVWSPNTMLQEALGQMHYLAYYAALGRLTGAIGNKFNISTNPVYKATAVVGPNLSMSAQMGYEAYENTKESLMKMYNDRVQETLHQLIQPELDKVDWNKELQNYKEQHSKGNEFVDMSDEEVIEMLKNQAMTQLIPEYISQAEVSNSDILNEARSQAIDAFRMESVMDLMKNSVDAATFRGWMYNNNKALQSSIRNNELKVKFFGNEAQAIKKPKALFARVAAKEILGEAFDEYLDGVTTGMSEGYNIAQFENYLINKENPGSLDNTSMMFRALSGLSMGVRNAFNEDNLYEAALGALSPIMPIFNRGSAKSGSTWRPFVSNAIYEEYVSQSDRYSSTEDRVARINKFLSENEDKITNIANLNAPNAAIDNARLKGDEKALKDAEQQQLIALASIFNEAQDNAAEASMVKQMTSTVDKLINDDYTEEEKKQLGTEFISQPENKNSKMTVEEGYERMRHNAQKLVETSEKLRKVEDRINSNKNTRDLSDNAKQHLVILSMQEEDWENRLNTLTKELGISKPTSTNLSVTDMANKEDAEQLVSELNSNISDLTSNSKDIDNKIKELEKKKEETNTDTKLSTKDKKAKIAALNSKIEGHNQAKTQLNKEIDRLTSQLNKEKKALDNWSDEREVLSADAIMNSGASKILYMLENKAKYNAEQRAQIDEAVNRLTNNDSDFLAKLDDASRIASSIEAGKRTTTAIQEGPKGYDLLVDALRLASAKTQIRREANRYKNQLFLEWDTKSPTEILQDNRLEPALIDEYRSRNNRARYDELQGISDVVALQKDLLGLVNKEDKVVEQALKQNIKTITSEASSKDEAVGLLNKFLEDKSIPQNVREDIQEVLDTAKILDKASAATFKQEKEEIARKEEQRKIKDEETKRQEEQQRIKANKKAEDAKANKSDSQEVSEEIETLEDSGQEVAEEVDRIEIGREPIEQIDKEEVYLGIEYSPNTEAMPSTETIIERELEAAEKKGIITDTRVEVSNTITGKAQEGEFVGNAYSRYRVIDGVVKLREETEPITGKLKSIFDWFDSAGINYQEVIDNELEAISQLDPDIKILKVNPKVNATNDAVMRDVNILVVEYTDDVAKIHRTNDSIITADGKKWLVIGSLGYNSAIDNQTTAFKNLTVNKGPLDTRFRKYWKANPTERFHVDEIAYTRISNINPGRLVREANDKPAGTRPVSELLNESGLQLRDAKWAIAKGTSLKVVGRIDDNSILNETGVAAKSGTVYLLIPSAGGRYIASYIQPSYTNTLRKGSELKSIIDNALTRLASDNHKDRYEALKELFQYIYLDSKNNQILIGQEDNNTITIIQEGISSTYNLDDPNTSKASVITDLLKSHFRIQINLSTLTDRDRLSLYDEGGALLTDLQKYGVSGADFNVVEMNTNGIPITIEEEKINRSISSSRTKTTVTLPYNGVLYTKTKLGWRDFSGNKVTDSTALRHLNYLEEISKGKTPSSTTDTHNQYVFSYDRNNPIVISVSNKSNTVTEFTKEEAFKYIENQEKEAEEKTREEALDKALKETYQPKEDVNLEEERDDIVSTEDFLFGEDKEESTEGTEDKELVRPSLELSKPDPNKLENPSPVGRGNNTTTVNDIIIDHNDRFISIIMKKIGEDEKWADFPMDSNEEMINYLEKKGLPIIGIPDVDVWFDILENCK